MNILKNKRFRYGTFSLVLLLLAFVLFVFVNLFADEFNRSRDLTAEQLFTLTSHSQNFLAELNRDVHITYITRIGQGHPTIFPIVSELLVEYASASSHITYEMRDPMLSPALIHGFASRAGIEGGIPDDSVVVESGNAIHVITPTDMVTFDFNMFGQPTGIRSYNFESEITRAIHRLAQGDPPVVYFVTGSGEAAINPGIIGYLESENFVLREVNLLLDDVPESADILFITLPTRDWTELKAERVRGFLDDSGRAFFALSFSPESTPVLDSVLAEYGVALGEHVILEGNPNNMLQNPSLIVPNLTHHEILDNIYMHRMFNLLLGAVEVETLPIHRGTLNIDTLWVTSSDAFARVEESDTLTQLPTDISGPFDLAVAITDNRFIAGTTITTQLVVVGNMGVISDTINASIGGSNAVFVRDALSWLHGQPAGIFVPGRVPPGSAPLMITQMQTNVMTGIALGVIPIGVLAVGVFVWFRRRHN